MPLTLAGVPELAMGRDPQQHFDSRPPLGWVRQAYGDEGRPLGWVRQAYGDEGRRYQPYRGARSRRRRGHYAVRDDQVCNADYPSHSRHLSGHDGHVEHYWDRDDFVDRGGGYSGRSLGGASGGGGLRSRRRSSSSRWLTSMAGRLRGRGCFAS